MTVMIPGAQLGPVVNAAPQVVQPAGRGNTTGSFESTFADLSKKKLKSGDASPDEIPGERDTPPLPPSPAGLHGSAPVADFSAMGTIAVGIPMVQRPDQSDASSAEEGSIADVLATVGTRGAYATGTLRALNEPAGASTNSSDIQTKPAPGKYVPSTAAAALQGASAHSAPMTGGIQNPLEDSSGTASLGPAQIGAVSGSNPLSLLSDPRTQNAADTAAPSISLSTDTTQVGMIQHTPEALRVTRTRTFLTAGSAASKGTTEALSRLSLTPKAGQVAQVRDSSGNGQRQEADISGSKQQTTDPRAPAVSPHAAEPATFNGNVAGLLAGFAQTVGDPTETDGPATLESVLSSSAPEVSSGHGLSTTPIKELEVQVSSETLGTVGVKMRLASGKVGLVIEGSTAGAANAIEQMRHAITDRVSTREQPVDTLVIRTAASGPTPSAPASQEASDNGGERSASGESRNPQARNNDRRAGRNGYDTRRPGRGDLLV